MKVLRCILLSFILAILVIPDVFSQDTLKQHAWTVNGYLKDMENVIFTRIDKQWISGNLIHNRLNFNWTISPSFRFVAGLRTRIFIGDMLTSIPGYGASFEADEGLVKLSWNLVSQTSYLLNTSLDRFWLDYSRGKFQVTVGRQRINWGLNFVWNPNDIFNTYSYLDFDYEEKPGSDAVRLQIYPNSTSRAELTVKASRDARITAAGLYRMNKLGYDFQFLGGIFDGNMIVAGAGWAGQVLKGGFTGELSYFQPVSKSMDSTGIIVAAVGYSYTFRNSLALQFEALYNGQQHTDLTSIIGFSENSSNALSAKNPFLPDFSFFGGITYPFHPLLTGSLSGIYNPVARVYIVIPSLTLSITNNIDLMLLGQVFEAYGPGMPFTNENLVFLRLKWNF